MDQRKYCPANIVCPSVVSVNIVCPSDVLVAVPLSRNEPARILSRKYCLSLCCSARVSIVCPSVVLCPSVV
jgi:hypothetical protein